MSDPIAVALISLTSRRDHLLEQLGTAGAEAAVANEQATNHQEALKHLVSMEEAWRGTFESAMAAIVSQSLRTIFGPDIKDVRVNRTTQRGVSSMKLVIVDNEDRETDIIDYEGGSLINVLDATLRILFTVSAKQRRCFIWDEPFSDVSKNYLPSLCNLLQELGERLNLQFIIASHEQEVLDAASSAYHIEKKGGVAHIERVKAPEEEVVTWQ